MFRFHKSKDHEIVQCNFSALDYGDIVKWILLHPPWSLLILCKTAHHDLSKVILSLLIIIIIIITHFIGNIRWYSLICSLVKGNNFVQCLFLQRLPAYIWSLTDFKHSSYNVRWQYTLTFAAVLVHTELEVASIQKWMQILCFLMQYGPIEQNVVVGSISFV